MCERTCELCLCACNINLYLTIRGFQCYAHPDKEQFTFSEIEHDQPLSNLTHRADVHGLCWTLSVVGQTGITHLPYCLSLLFFLFLRSEISDWRSILAYKWSGLSDSEMCLNIIKPEQKIPSGHYFRRCIFLNVVYNWKSYCICVNISSHLNISVGPDSFGKCWVNLFSSLHLSCRCTSCVVFLCVCSIPALPGDLLVRAV